MENLAGEAIFVKHYAVGKDIDLEGFLASGRVPGVKCPIKVGTRDTSATMKIPKPIQFEIDMNVLELHGDGLKGITMEAKLYTSGVISMITRVEFHDRDLARLLLLKNQIQVTTADGKFNIERLSDNFFDSVLYQVRSYIIPWSGPARGLIKSSLYCIVCIWNCMNGAIEMPGNFIHENRNLIASLLLGAENKDSLHESQIENATSVSFSFKKNEIAMFEKEHAIIISHERDYQDMVLVVEVATYQLLEMTVLDEILDNQMEILHGELMKTVMERKAKQIAKRMRDLLEVQVDATLVLENIENVSNMIGNYFLANIYTRMREHLRLQEWSDSVRSRINTLIEIYSTTKSDRSETMLIRLEIGLAFVFIMEFVFLLVDLFLI